MGIFDFFCSYNFDLDAMTFRYELDPYSLEIYRMCKYELHRLGLAKVIVRQTDTNRQTQPKLHTTPLRGWSKISFTLKRQATPAAM